MMKMWEKNYLIALLLFVLALNGGLFTLAIYINNSELKEEVNAATADVTRLFHTIQAMEEMEDTKKIIASLGYSYKAKGIYLGIAIGNEKIYNSIPDKIESKWDEYIYVYENKQSSYINVNYYPSSLTSEYKINYFTSLDALNDGQRNRTIIFTLFSIVVSAIVGAILYITMKKMNKPVDDIAHELRTPLTSIQGYAQYILNTNSTDENTYLAPDKVVSESRRMQKLIDNILIIGGLRTRKIIKKKVPRKEIKNYLSGNYPQVTLGIEAEGVSCDSVLFASLLDNLISNALRESGDVQITIKKDRMYVKNSCLHIDRGLLRKMNKRRPLPEKYIQGNGYGLPLCYEIVKLHGWGLRYEFDGEYLVAAVLF